MNKVQLLSKYHYNEPNLHTVYHAVIYRLLMEKNEVIKYNRLTSTNERRQANIFWWFLYTPNLTGVMSSLQKP